jgi:hypothetical protein
MAYVMEYRRACRLYEGDEHQARHPMPKTLHVQPGDAEPGLPDVPEIDGEPDHGVERTGRAGLRDREAARRDAVLVDERRPGLSPRATVRRRDEQRPPVRNESPPRNNEPTISYYASRLYCLLDRRYGYLFHRLRMALAYFPPPR